MPSQPALVNNVYIHKPHPCRPLLSGSCYHILRRMQSAGLVKEGEGLKVRPAAPFALTHIQPSIPLIAPSSLCFVLQESHIAAILKAAITGLQYFHKAGNIHRCVRVCVCAGSSWLSPTTHSLTHHHACSAVASIVALRPAPTLTHTRTHTQ